VEQNGLALQYASKKFQNNTSIVTTAVGQNGLALEFASLDLQNDPIIVTIAVQRDGLALEFASPGLKGDGKMARAAMMNNMLALQYATPEVRQGIDEQLQLYMQEDQEEDEFLRRQVFQRIVMNNVDLTVKRSKDSFRLFCKARWDLSKYFKDNTVDNASTSSSSSSNIARYLENGTVDNNSSSSSSSSDALAGAAAAPPAAAEGGSKIELEYPHEAKIAAPPTEMKTKHGPTLSILMNQAIKIYEWNPFLHLALLKCLHCHVELTAYAQHWYAVHKNPGKNPGDINNVPNLYLYITDVRYQKLAMGNAVSPSVYEERREDVITLTQERSQLRDTYEAITRILKSLNAAAFQQQQEPATLSEILLDIHTNKYMKSMMKPIKGFIKRTEKLNAKIRIEVERIKLLHEKMFKGIMFYEHEAANCMKLENEVEVVMLDKTNATTRPMRETDSAVISRNVFLALQKMRKPTGALSRLVSSITAMLAGPTLDPVVAKRICSEILPRIEKREQLKSLSKDFGVFISYLDEEKESYHELLAKYKDDNVSQTFIRLLWLAEHVSFYPWPFPTITSKGEKRKEKQDAANARAKSFILEFTKIGTDTTISGILTDIQTWMVAMHTAKESFGRKVLSAWSEYMFDFVRNPSVESATDWQTSIADPSQLFKDRGRDTEEMYDERANQDQKRDEDLAVVSSTQDRLDELRLRRKISREKLTTYANYVYNQFVFTLTRLKHMMDFTRDIINERKTIITTLCLAQGMPMPTLGTKPRYADMFLTLGLWMDKYHEQQKLTHKAPKSKEIHDTPPIPDDHTTPANVLNGVVKVIDRDIIVTYLCGPFDLLRVMQKHELLKRLQIRSLRELIFDNVCPVDLFNPVINNEMSIQALQDQALDSILGFKPPSRTIHARNPRASVKKHGPAAVLGVEREATLKECQIAVLRIVKRYLPHLLNVPSSSGVGNAISPDRGQNQRAPLILTPDRNDAGVNDHQREHAIDSDLEEVVSSYFLMKDGRQRFYAKNTRLEEWYKMPKWIRIVSEKLLEYDQLQREISDLLNPINDTRREANRLRILALRYDLRTLQLDNTANFRLLDSRTQELIKGAAGADLVGDAQYARTTASELRAEADRLLSFEQEGDFFTADPLEAPLRAGAMRIYTSSEDDASEDGSDYDDLLDSEDSSSGGEGESELGSKRRRDSLGVKDPALRQIMRDRSYTLSSLQHDTCDDHTELLFTI